MSKGNKTEVLQIKEYSTEDFWRKRKIDWHLSYFTPEHFHRKQIIEVLKELKFDSVLELGCGAGANLWKIKEQFPDVLVAGIDINEDAVKETLKHFPAEVGMAESINHPDKCVDLILTDACLMYVPPEKINDTIKEMLRVARKYIVMVEWNGEDKYADHWVYDYKNKYKNHNVQITKIKGWIGGWEEYGAIIKVEVENK